MASLGTRQLIVSGDNSGHDMSLIISLLVVGTIIDGLCYWSNKDLMLVTLLFYFFAPSALGMAVLEGESYSLSDYRGSMLPFSLSPGPSGLPFSVLISPLSFLFFSFSLLLRASVLVVIPFRTGSFQTTSTRCATLLPVSVGLIIRVCL